MFFYVYEHWRPDTGECFYVGKGCGKRAWQLKRRNEGHQAVLSKLVALGLAVDVRIVAADLLEADALTLEIERIALYPSGSLANRTKGGAGLSGIVYSAAVREKMSRARMGMQFSEAHRANISAAAKGRKLSSAHKEKISLGGNGRVVSIETGRKISEAKRGRSFSEHHKLSLSGAHTGKSHGPHTPEAKARIAAAIREWWAVKKTKGTG